MSLPPPLCLVTYYLAGSKLSHILPFHLTVYQRSSHLPLFLLLHSIALCVYAIVCLYCFLSFIIIISYVFYYE